MKLAELCNLSTGYISEIESGKKFPTDTSIDKIADSLKVKPYQLFIENDLTDEDNKALIKQAIIDLKAQIISDFDKFIS